MQSQTYVCSLPSYRAYLRIPQSRDRPHRRTHKPQQRINRCDPSPSRKGKGRNCEDACELFPRHVTNGFIEAMFSHHFSKKKLVIITRKRLYCKSADNAQSTGMSTGMSCIGMSTGMSCIGMYSLGNTVCHFGLL